jgi:SAM-dependent methyltransferase
MHAEQLKLFADIEARHWWFTARREIVRRIVEQAAPPSTNRKIVDIGCGTGGNLAVFAAHYRCAGIDASPAAVQLARERFPNVSFTCGAVAEQLPAVAADADVLLLMDVIEHVADDFEFFSEVAARCRPGALLLVTVPADMSLWSPHDETVLHYRRYEPARLRQLWAGLPLRERFFSYFNSRLYPFIKTLRQRNRARGESSGAAGTDFNMPPAPVNALLRRVFAGESAALLRALASGQRMPYRRGVSLIALLEREPGVINPRRKPPDIPDDPFKPAAF